jgi:hypothetical protein
MIVPHALPIFLQLILLLSLLMASDLKGGANGSLFHPRSTSWIKLFAAALCDVIKFIY